MSSPLILTREDGEAWSFDGCPRISFTPRARLTDHPVEDGSTTTDHRQRLPNTITITGTVTATPRSGATYGQVTGEARMYAARDFLDGCDGFVEIETPDEVYTGYMLVGWGHDRTSRRSMTFTLEFREVRIATAQTVTIPVTAPVEGEAAGLPDEVDAGEQATENTAALESTAVGFRSATAEASTSSTATSDSSSADPAGEEADTSILYEMLYGDEPPEET